MAVNLQSADKALKTLYLDVVAEQLNDKINPLLARIKRSSNDVWGKEVRKLAVYGVNGGVGAGTEDGSLPAANGNNYEQFVLTLKNLYGTIEISDKAVRASENNSGAFVNLLTAEMEGLVKASRFNFGRMLFGDGSGVLAKVVKVNNGVLFLDSVKNLVEGMTIDLRDCDDFTPIAAATGRRILSVDRTNKSVKVSGATLATEDAPEDSLVTVQGSYMNEITGLGKLFDTTSTSIYGVSKAGNSWLKPYVKENAGTLTEAMIQTALDTIEEETGSVVNYIVCSMGVRRAFVNLLSANKRTVDSLDLEGGFKALSYNGIPVVADRFCPDGCMYLLNTDDFTIHQLCDWQWLSDDDGRILKQVPGKPVYTATLVKYAELMCSRPAGQGLIKGITEA